MEELVLEALAKKAYETHVGIGEKKEKYFKFDASSWEELPASTRVHWKKIVRSIVMSITEIDCGDLK